MLIRRPRLRARRALRAMSALPGLALVHGQPKPRPRPADKADVKPEKKFAWTTDEALAQLAIHPRDPFLQYVALQTARREKKLEAAGTEVERAVFGGQRPVR